MKRLTKLEMAQVVEYELHGRSYRPVDDKCVKRLARRPRSEVLYLYLKANAAAKSTNHRTLVECYVLVSQTVDNRNMTWGEKREYWLKVAKRYYFRLNTCIWDAAVAVDSEY